MPTIAERLETATTALEAAVGTLSTGVTTATTKASEASASAATATTKAGDAETARAAAVVAKTAAETAETNAETAETNAETAQTAAEAAQAAAVTAKNAAQTAQTAAETAKTGAETAQTGAQTAKTAAEAARDLAQTYRDTASTHKDSAAASATAAAGSATTAGTQAANSATSASAAAVSAGQAAAIAAGLNYKGTVAGASVAATSTASGDCYLISSAGTSQSKTWAAGDLAIYRGTSGNWDQIAATVVMGIASALRNGASPRGGVAFNGQYTSYVALPSNFSAQWNADLFSMAFAFVWNGGSGYLAGGGDGTSTGLGCVSITSNGAVQVNYAGTAGLVSSNGVVSATEPNILIVTKNGTSIKAYLNNTLVINGTDATAWTNPPTVLGRLNFPANQIGFNGVINSFTYYDLELSAADALEIYKLGGAVPYRFQFGNGTGMITGDSSTFTSGLGAFNDYGVGRITHDAVNGRMSVSYGAVYNQVFYGPIGGNNGKRYRVQFDVINWVGSGTVRLNTNLSGAVAVGTFSGDGTKSFEYTSNQSPSALEWYNNTANTASFQIDNFQEYQIGARFHCTFDEGIGYQLHNDAYSANGVGDAIMSLTGVAHTMPQRRGFVRGTLTWSGTHESKSLLGQRAWPNGCVVERVTVKPSAGSSGSGLTAGDASTANRFVTSVAITTSKKVLSLAEATPAGTSDAQNNPTIDPDSANYTGSIQAQFDFVQTEG